VPSNESQPIHSIQVFSRDEFISGFNEMWVIESFTGCLPSNRQRRRRSGPVIMVVWDMGCT
jgi:hypothetical protein